MTYVPAKNRRDRNHNLREARLSVKRPPPDRKPTHGHAQRTTRKEEWAEGEMKRLGLVNVRREP